MRTALEVEALLRTLRQHEVEFVVIGGLAVAAHGYVRATKDLDIVPRPDHANRRRLYTALQSLDAEPLELADLAPGELPVAFGADALDGGGNWALQTSRGRIDVMQWVSAGEDYERLSSNALVVDVPDVGQVMFAGFEDLVAMKDAADRPEDRVDLDRLRELRRA